MKLARFDLDFAPSSRVSRVVVLVLLLLAVLLIVAGMAFIDANRIVGARRAELKQREASETVVIETPRRNADETKRLQQEIKAVNVQIRQLNQRWDVLLNDLRSYPGGDVRLLSLEVDAHSGSIRVEAVTPATETMTDYATYLADKKSLRSVLISRHELDANGVRFTVDGKWAEKL